MNCSTDLPLLECFVQKSKFLSLATVFFILPQMVTNLFPFYIEIVLILVYKYLEEYIISIYGMKGVGVESAHTDNCIWN